MTDIAQAQRRPRPEDDRRQPRAAGQEGEDERGRQGRRARRASRPRPTSTALKGCDLVIEAATENLELKLKIFGQLDALAKPDAILASNTSSISITRLAAATKRPDKVIGMHFFNPVPVMQLVELIRGLQTSDATYAAVEAITKKIGKAPVKVQELARVRREPPALPDDQRGDLRARRRARDRGRDRRGDEARLQPPDRPARALRPDRARRRARGDERAVRGLQGPEVPPRAAARRDGRGGVPRAQDRARVLHRTADRPVRARRCANRPTCRQNSRPRKAGSSRRRPGTRPAGRGALAARVSSTVEEGDHGGASSTRFRACCLHHAQVRGDRPAIREKDLGIWQTWTW